VPDSALSSRPSLSIDGEMRKKRADALRAQLFRVLLIMEKRFNDMRILQNGFIHRKINQYYCATRFPDWPH
jgi:hypothetical protein